MLQQPLLLGRLLLADAGGFLGERFQSPGRGVDEEALQRVVVVERADQIPLGSCKLLQRAIEIGQTPFLDAVQLLLHVEDAVDLDRIAHSFSPSPASP